MSDILALLALLVAFASFWYTWNVDRKRSRRGEQELAIRAENAFRGLADRVSALEANAPKWPQAVVHYWSEFNTLIDAMRLEKRLKQFVPLANDVVSWLKEWHEASKKFHGQIPHLEKQYERHRTLNPRLYEAAVKLQRIVEGR